MEEIDIKANSIYIRASDTNTVGTSTDDLTELVYGGTSFVSPLRGPDAMGPVHSSVHHEPFLQTAIANNNDNNENRDDIHTGQISRIPPDKDILSSIASSENPLLDLYTHYGPLIREDWRLKLLHTSVMEATTIKTPKLVLRIFSLVENELQKFQEEAFKTLRHLIVCEKSGLSLIKLKQTDQLDSFIDSVVEFLKSLGELEAKYVDLELKGTEYRRMFELLLPRKIQLGEEGKTEFENCYKLFTVCQSKTSEFHNRLKTLKQACERSKLTENVENIHSFYTGHGDRNSSKGHFKDSIMDDEQSLITSQSIISEYHDSIGQGDEEDGDHENGVIQTTSRRSMNHSKGRKGANNTLSVDNIHAAMKTIKFLQEEIEMLKIDLFESEQQQDRTPGALLFFTALYDPAAVSAMTNTIMELKAMRSVCDGSEYIDFHSLRKRLLVCVSNMPSIDRFVNKFQKMHSSWTQSRAKLFSSRNQAGGDADTTYACPLCCNDSRLLSRSMPYLPEQKHGQPHLNQNQQGGMLLSTKRSMSARVVKDEDPDFMIGTKENDHPQLLRPQTSPTKRSKSMTNMKTGMDLSQHGPSTGHKTKNRYKEVSKFSSDDNKNILRNSRSRGGMNEYLNASLTDNSTGSTLPSLTMSQTEKMVRNKIKIRNW